MSNFQTKCYHVRENVTNCSEYDSDSTHIHQAHWKCTACSDINT